MSKNQKGLNTYNFLFDLDIEELGCQFFIDFRENTVKWLRLVYGSNSKPKPFLM